MVKEGKNKRGQVTVFIIIAIIVVLLGGIIYMFWEGDLVGDIPENFESLEKDFLSCVESKTLIGIEILSNQGGYIKMPEYVPGSSYMPFSSELDFFGVNIPYWYFVSGNNVDYSRIPSIEMMEESLARYLEGEVVDCGFEKYFDGGYVVKKGEPEIEISIFEDNVRVNLDMDIFMKKDEESFVVKDHQVEVSSSYGKLYSEAVSFYEINEANKILDNYTIDFLRLYAPVDGFELTCAPMVWNSNQVFNDLHEAIDANFMAMKNHGAEEDYFALDFPIDSEITLVSSKNFPYTFEVSPTDGEIMVAEPMGNQPEFAALGFCYVNYHFVYDLKFPVLVILENEGDFFQFPISIIIDNNVFRDSEIFPLDSGSNIPNLCEDKVTRIRLHIQNEVGQDIPADVSYKCLLSDCDIGRSENGYLEGNFPQCVNGELIVEADGYKDFSMIISTVEESSMELYLQKEFEKEIVLNLDNHPINSRALISFSDGDFTKTVVYPENKNVELSAGTYDVSVSVYSNSQIKFPETKSEYCVEAPSSGISGLLGFTTEKCSEIIVPEQTISNVLVGGGSSEITFSEFDLRRDNKMNIFAKRLPTPKNLEELQVNYQLWEVREIEVRFE